MIYTPTQQTLWILEPDSEFRSLLIELSLIHGNSTWAAHDLPSAWSLLSSETSPVSTPHLLICNWKVGDTTCAEWILAVQQRHPRVRTVCLVPEGPVPCEDLPPSVRFLSQPQLLSELIALLAPNGDPK